MQSTKTLINKSLQALFIAGTAMAIAPMEAMAENLSKVAV